MSKQREFAKMDYMEMEARAMAQMECPANKEVKELSELLRATTNQKDRAALKAVLFGIIYGCGYGASIDRVINDKATPTSAVSILQRLKAKWLRPGNIMRRMPFHRRAV